MKFVPLVLSALVVGCVPAQEVRNTPEYAMHQQRKDSCLATYNYEMALVRERVDRNIQVWREDLATGRRSEAEVHAAAELEIRAVGALKAAAQVDADNCFMSSLDTLKLDLMAR